MSDWSPGILDQLQREIKSGGDLSELPCPFCGLPRCSRSDYVRCSKCGINWLEGEDLSKDPTLQRFAALKGHAPLLSNRKPIA